MEFFLEGTRSRSGKSLPPKLGKQKLNSLETFCGSVLAGWSSRVGTRRASWSGACRYLVLGLDSFCPGGVFGGGVDPNGPIRISCTINCGMFYLLYETICSKLGLVRNRKEEEEQKCTECCGRFAASRGNHDPLTPLPVQHRFVASQ